MKKIAMTLLLGYSISFSSDCVKMQIDELRYMKKEELVDSYKTQTAYSNIEQKYMQEMTKIARQQETLEIARIAMGKNDNTKPSYKTDIEKSENNDNCYKQNKTNIKRVLEKDFNVTEDELNRLINLEKTK